MTALSVIGFPVRKIPDKALSDILRGGIDKMKEAGVSVIGGHSINDAEIKAGFAVTGLIDKSKVKTNSSAQVGDVLILTKPLGTGIISFASQIGYASESSINAAAASMTTLNKTAAELMVEFKAHAATDVTGFSLMGHLSEMALRSGVDVQILWDALPWLEGVLDYAAQSVLPGAIERNKESCGHAVIAAENVSELMIDICFDPQTSGGLLIAIDPDQADEFLNRLHESGVTHAVGIGHVTSKGSGMINVTTEQSRQIPINPAVLQQTTNNRPANESKTEGSEGLDAYTKRAIRIAISAANQSEANLETEIEKARQMGYTQSEIDEVIEIAKSIHQ